MATLVSGRNISITSCAVGVALYRLNGQSVEVASMNYRKAGKFTSRRLLMETGVTGQKVAHVLHKCIMTEAADPIKRDSFRILTITNEPVAYAFGPDQNNSEGTHLKLIYGAEVMGELWTANHVDEEDHDEEHWDLKYMEAEETVRRMEIQKSPPIHRKGVLGLVDFLAREHSSVAMRYHRMLARENVSIPSEDMAIIQRFIEKGF